MSTVARKNKNLERKRLKIAKQVLKSSEEAEASIAEEIKQYPWYRRVGMALKFVFAKM